MGVDSKLMWRIPPAPPVKRKLVSAFSIETRVGDLPWVRVPDGPYCHETATKEAARLTRRLLETGHEVSVRLSANGTVSVRSYR